MGGRGSGNWYRSDKKTTTSEVKFVDARWLARKGWLENGLYYSIWWSSNGKSTGDIRVMTYGDSLKLIYRFRSGLEEWQDVEETVHLNWTSCNFGSQRVWFICPGVVDGRYCGRRVGMLYLGGRYFLCRHCYELTYSTRQEREPFRLLTKAQKIRERLGASISILDPVWEKPKGMHWTTFHRLVSKASEAEYMSNLALARQLGILVNF